jgi:hypothetical protein
LKKALRRRMKRRSRGGVREGGEGAERELKEEEKAQREK